MRYRVTLSLGKSLNVISHLGAKQVSSLPVGVVKQTSAEQTTFGSNEEARNMLLWTHFTK